ncbi:MAG: CARDB domain-containing protein [Dehalococcoidia bacterium]
MVLACLFLAGCSLLGIGEGQPRTPASSPTPSVAAASVATPTPAATPTPGPTPTAVPTLEPVGDRPVQGDLRHHAPSGWDGPLVVTNQSNGRTLQSVSNTAPIYVSWAYRNAGPRTITGRHHVDIYLNDVFVERWASPPRTETSGHIAVTDWDGLPDHVRLSPGTHRLRLVLDPLDQVAETDETNNVYEVDLVVTGSAAPVTPGRAPDIAFTTPRDWDAPVVVNSYDGRTHGGPLSTDVATHIHYAFANQGAMSVLQAVPVHIYLNGILVREQRWDAALAGQRITSAWDGLMEEVRITPGEHTLRVVLDPGNLVLESNSSNNVFEHTFTWNTGSVASAPLLPVEPEPTPPPVVTRPDLVPHWRHGWDGPITVSNAPERFTNDPIVVGQRPYINLVVSNQSTHASGPFSVELYFNGELVRTERFQNGLQGGIVSWVADWDRLLDHVNPQAGDHDLRMVIDPHNEVDEWDQTNNEYSTVIRWHTSTPAATAPRTYTTSQLRSTLSNLPVLLDDQRPVLGQGSVGNTQQLLEMAEAGYYLMTGESFLDQRQAIHLLANDDYLAWVNQHFAVRFATSPTSRHADLLEQREKFKTSVLGMMTRHKGVATIVVDAERPFADVLNTLVHEMGHARQDFLNPGQSEAQQTHFLKGVQEAQAQQFERAFWLRASEFLDTPLFSYPRHPALESLIDAHFDNWYANRMADEHDLGHLLAWVAALADTSVSHIGDSLTNEGQLGPSEALELYHHLVGLDASVIESYVEARLALIEQALPTMRTLGKGRLRSNMPPSREASQHLRVPGLMMP